jgi:hypothetical protein
MQALRNELIEANRKYTNISRALGASRNECATLEARLALAQNNRAPAPVIGIEYNVHTVKARLRGVVAELTVKDESLKTDLAALGELKNDTAFVDMCEPDNAAGEAYAAIDRVCNRLKPLAGVVECGICYEPITAATAMVGKTCHHIFCQGCVESNMAAPTQEGVGNMRCPFRCAGMFSNNEHWTLFQEAKAALESEGDSTQIAEEVLESPEDRLQSLVSAGVLLLIPFNGPDGSSWEEVKDGPLAGKRKRDDDGSNENHPKIWTLQDKVLKKLPVPFKFAQLGGGKKSVQAWDALAKESGCAKGWVRRVPAGQAGPSGA